MMKSIYLTASLMAIFVGLNLHVVAETAAPEADLAIAEGESDLIATYDEAPLPPGLEALETAETLYEASVMAPGYDPVIDGIRREYATAGIQPLGGDSGDLPPPDENTLFMESLRAFAILSFLCGFIVLAAYLVKRFGRSSPLLAGPSLGKELGRVYLNPKATLHYIQSGDRVLVVGVTPAAINLITEFDAATFDGAEARPAFSAPTSNRPLAFQDQLKTADARINRNTASADDEEIDALRGDIKRLQQYLQDSARENQ